jgi:hypothetical protein
VASRKTGDWKKARGIFTGLSSTVSKAADASIQQEAHFLRGRMVQGISEQSPGGQRFKPLSPLTLASRRLRRFPGTKALIVRADLRNGITVARQGGKTFIGILRQAKDSSGKNLVDLAAVHEFGAGPIVMKVTPKMRRFLAVLYKQAGIPRISTGSSGGGYVVIRIPARPFIRPVFDRDAKPADVKKRLEERMARILKSAWKL